MNKSIYSSLALSILLHLVVLVFVMASTRSVSPSHSFSSSTSWTLQESETALQKSSAPAVVDKPSLGEHKRVDTFMPEANGGSAAGSDALRATYLARLQARLESAKTYPKLARLKKQEGVVKISFTIQADGVFENIRLLQSSRIEELDEAALTLVVRSAKFEPLPNELGSSLEVTLPIGFRILR